MEPFVYANFPRSLTVENLFTFLQESISIAPEKAVSGNLICFDTFDWRLFRKRLVLLRSNNSFFLTDLNFQNHYEQLIWRKKQPPRFYWDFPASGLKNELQPLMDVRALLPVADFQRKSQAVRVLNDDDKTVLKLEIDTLKPVATDQELEPVNLLKIQPVRGYRKEAKRVKTLLEQSGFDFSSETLFEMIAKAAGATPGDYSSKLTIQLAPRQSSVSALKTILTKLFRTMKKNEAGIKADLDTEFLHDFRVAIRRTRSAITQIKGVLPGQETDRFKQAFAQFGRATNKLRDLDVYLLDKNRYEMMLPEHLRPGLTPLFKSLRRQRRTELNKVIQFLTSDFYQTTLREWQAFLTNLDENQVAARHGKTPVLKLAKKIIFKQYKRVIRDGEKITDTTPDADLHRLRIDCKKLRYSLEFFSSLFPGEGMARLIKQFKRLQDNLGEFNDLSVQQNQLEEFLTNMNSKNAHSAPVSSAVGGLISVLFQRQKSVRNAFRKTFDAFHTRETDDLFARLFR